MELKDTLELISSEDYTDRFKAEYLQLKIRLDKLENMIAKYEAGTLDFKPKCTLDLLKLQRAYMREYLYVLKVRAEIENVNLQE